MARLIGARSQRPNRAPLETAIVLVGFFLMTGAWGIRAADWNEWRGPLRNGVVEKSPPLLEAWPEKGPKKLWESEEKIGGAARGGYGSVVFADGRVFVFETPRHVEPLKTRTLDDRNLTALGWQAKMPPKDLSDAIEKARLSEERTQLKDRKAIQAWAKQWTTDKMDAEQRKSFARFASARLIAGPSAVEIPVLEKLAQIKGKEFADQASLEDWFAKNGIEGEVRKRVAAKFPDKRTVGTDDVICLDAANGKTLWRASFPGVVRGHGSSSTPCVTGGKCYIIGSDGDAYALDVKTGAKIWHQKIGKGEKNASFVVVDGVALIPAGPLTGLDAEAGKVLWSHEKFGLSNASPVLWVHGGKTYVVARVKGALVCLDPKPGTVLWTVKDSDSGPHAGSTPAVEGDTMAVSGSRGLVLYKLSTEKAEVQATVSCPMDYSNCPIIIGGHAYAFGRKGSSCISFESGKVVWKDDDLKGSAYIAPIWADNKVFLQGSAGKGYGDGSLFMFAVSSEKGQVLAKAPVKQVLCTTPALANGLIYCRTAKGIACYDLRK